MCLSGLSPRVNEGGEAAAGLSEKGGSGGVDPIIKDTAAGEEAKVAELTDMDAMVSTDKPAVTGEALSLTFTYFT